MQSAKYTKLAVILHWVSALLIFGLLSVGLWMRRFEEDLGFKFELYQLHKSVGFTLLALLLIRLFWRFTHKPPEYATPLSPSMERAAEAVHWVMYGLMLLLPLSGWISVSVAELQFPTLYFGLFEIPHLSFLNSNPEFWRELSGWMHTLGAIALTLLLFGHIGAAIMHTVVLKDGLIKRMMP